MRIRDPVADAAFLRELELHRKAMPPVAVIADVPVVDPIVVIKN